MQNVQDQFSQIRWKRSFCCVETKLAKKFGDNFGHFFSDLSQVKFDKRKQKRIEVCKFQVQICVQEFAWPST